MKKKKQQINQLIMAFVCIIIVVVTIYKMFPYFSFHTYSQVVYYDYHIQGGNDSISLLDFELYYDEKVQTFGGGIITIQNPETFHEQLGISASEETLLKIIILEPKKEEVILAYDVVYNDSFPLIALPYHNEGKEIIDATSDKILRIQNGDTCMEVALTQKEMIPLHSATKEYRLETVAVKNNLVRLGKLKSSEDLTKKYDEISLEYRYLIDENGDMMDIDNYVVFTKVNATTKEYFNTFDFGNYRYEGEGILEDKQLSVVVILSKGEKEFVFSMPLEKVEE